MDELKNYLETVIALTTKHISDDEAWLNDAINGRFNAGRLAVEKADLEIFKTILDKLNKL